MKPAIFFQKYGECYVGKVLQKIYLMLLKTNNSRISYLRDAGAKIGENCSIQQINTFGSEPYLITVGNNVYFTASCQLVTHDGAISRLKYMEYTDKMYDMFAPIKIGDNCFIGTNSIILKGCNLGNNCIVGAGAIVTKSFSDNSVVAGVPAKKICTTKEFYEKNKTNFIDTHGMNRYKKRIILEKIFCER